METAGDRKTHIIHICRAQFHHGLSFPLGKYANIQMMSACGSHLSSLPITPILEQQGEVFNFENRWGAYNKAHEEVWLTVISQRAELPGSPGSLSSSDLREEQGKMGTLRESPLLTKAPALCWSLATCSPTRRRSGLLHYLKEKQNDVRRLGEGSQTAVTQLDMTPR